MVKDVIIDITADQFGAQYPKVIVSDSPSEYFFQKELSGAFPYLEVLSNI
jgi:hypothetical protein